MTQKEIDEIRAMFPETKPVAFNYIRAREIMFNLLGELSKAANTGPELVALDKPLTRAEIIRNADGDGYIEGIVNVPQSILVDYNNDFLDLVSEYLTGNECLTDTKCKILGCGKSNDVFLLITGFIDIVTECGTDDITIKLPEKFSFNSKKNTLTSGMIYQAERINEHGDYLVTWNRNDDETKKENANSEYYTENEVKYYVSTGQWIINEKGEADDNNSY